MHIFKRGKYIEHLYKGTISLHTCHQKQHVAPQTELQELLTYVGNIHYVGRVNISANTVSLIHLTCTSLGFSAAFLSLYLTPAACNIVSVDKITLSHGPL